MKYRAVIPAVLLAVACGGEAKPPAAAPPAAEPTPAPAPAAPVAPDVLLEGTVQLEPTLMFRSCEARTITAALDSTGGRLVSTYRLMQAQNGPSGMYLLVHGATAPDGTVILREIEYASLPSATVGCDQPKPNGDIVARGAKPDWRLVISGSGIEYSPAPDSASIVLPAVTPTVEGTMIRYELPAGAGGSHTVLLQLTSAPCNFGGGYTYGSMQASLTIDGKPLLGCAWRQRLR